MLLTFRLGKMETIADIYIAPAMNLADPVGEFPMRSGMAKVAITRARLLLDVAYRQKHTAGIGYITVLYTK